MKTITSEYAGMGDGAMAAPSLIPVSPFSPAHLSLACLFNGIEPIPTDQSFSCFDFGDDTATCAASLRAGQFHSGTGLADDQTSLSEFDFIFLSDAWANGTSEERERIVRFVASHLKPGGLLLIGYHALPGCNACHTLRHILSHYQEQYRACHRCSEEDALQATGAYVDALIASDAKYLEPGCAARALWDALAPASSTERVRMLGAARGTPQYFTDVEQDLAQIKLEFVSSGDFAWIFPQQGLTQEQWELASDVSDAALRETLCDFFRNTAFRRDLFVRGGRQMSSGRTRFWLERVRLACTDDAILPNVDDPRAHAILRALEAGPQTLACLQSRLGLERVPARLLFECIAPLLASGAVFPVFDTRLPATKENT